MALILACLSAPGVSCGRALGVAAGRSSLIHKPLMSLHKPLKSLPARNGRRSFGSISDCFHCSFHCFPLFFIVSHCSCAGGFSLAVARACIVIGTIGAL